MLVLHFILFSVSVVTVSLEQCVNYGSTYVTINYEYEPYWYQKKFSRCVDGKKLKDIKAYTLSFDKTSYDVAEVSNFPDLKDIYMDNFDIDQIPVFNNLPKIKKISLSSNKLKKIKKANFAQLPVIELIFSTNRISTIQDGSFGNNVKSIYLTCNNLTELSPKWFKNPAALELLHLGGNQLTAVPDNMFKDFINLRQLELRNNQIVTLGNGAISGPADMQYIHLSYNNISEIKANVFGPKINVSKMDIQYNRLSFLHDDMMNKLTVKNLLIWGNPWQCPCKDKITVWIEKNNKQYSTGLAREEDPSCVYALSFQQSCVPFVDNELYKTFLMNFEVFPIQFC